MGACILLAKQSAQLACLTIPLQGNALALLFLVELYRSHPGTRKAKGKTEKRRKGNKSTHVIYFAP
jgi:hypothetical protein